MSWVCLYIPEILQSAGFRASHRPAGFMVPWAGTDRRDEGGVRLRPGMGRSCSV